MFKIREREDVLYNSIERLSDRRSALPSELTL